MAALTRGLLSKFSQLAINPGALRTNGLAALTCPLKTPSFTRIQPSEAFLVRNLRSSVSSDSIGVRRNAANQPKPAQEVMENNEALDLAITKDVVAKVNAQIQSNTHGRLFAIVHFAGKQNRVTDGDLIMIEGNNPTAVGDVIRLEKVLLLGSKDFTLIGRPLLRPDLVRVEATVVEKSLTHTKTFFKKKRRKNYKRINFFRNQFTILRINCVCLEGPIDERPEFEGIDGRVF